MTDSHTVLVVDDSRVSRLMARQYILADHPDWIIEEAATGEEALEKVRGFAADLIIIDVNMPGMGGVAAAEQLRARCPQAHISLLTANVQSSMRERAHALGIGFMEKPITEERMAALCALVAA
jgi:CheY-like chemotaxis protein